MRVKEWYGYSFPELAKIATDNEVYCKLVEFLGDKINFSEVNKEGIAAITLDEDIA
jgi:RNA processing factor Prp31